MRIVTNRFLFQAEDWAAGGRCEGPRVRRQQEEHTPGIERTSYQGLLRAHPALSKKHI